MHNIKKVIVYLLSNAFNEVIVIGAALLIGIASPLNALQLLWINFFQDSFPAIAMAFENRGHYLERKPQHMRRGLLDIHMKFLIAAVGIVVSFSVLFAYFFLLRFGLSVDLVKTFVFVALGVTALVSLYSTRNLTDSIFSQSLFSNIYLIGSTVFGLLLMGIAIYVPFFQDLLGTVALPAPWIFGILAISVFDITLIEICKWFFRVWERRTGAKRALAA